MYFFPFLNMMNKFFWKSSILAYQQQAELVSEEEIDQEVTIDYSQQKNGQTDYVPSKILYVAHLDEGVTEQMLYSCFGEKGDLISVKLYGCDFEGFRDASVKYRNPQHAAKAIDDLNFTQLNGKPMRIECVNIDDCFGGETVLVQNLDKSISQKAFYDIFSTVGNMIRSRVMTEAISGDSEGYGYVVFRAEDDAQKAIESLNGKRIQGKKIYIRHLCKIKNNLEKDHLTDTLERSILVDNLADNIDNHQLYKMFDSYGIILTAEIMEVFGERTGQIIFSTSQEAARAILGMDKNTVNGKALSVTSVATLVEDVN